jgi:hypothetical protein
VCTAYIRIAGAEFMRAFCRSHELKKSSEHRKKISAATAEIAKEENFCSDSRNCKGRMRR